jgi:hypothetical protein
MSWLEQEGATLDKAFIGEIGQWQILNIWELY